MQWNALLNVTSYVLNDQLACLFSLFSFAFDGNSWENLVTVHGDKILVCVY